MIASSRETSSEYERRTNGPKRKTRRVTNPNPLLPSRRILFSATKLFASYKWGNGAKTDRLRRRQVAFALNIDKREAAITNLHHLISVSTEVIIIVVKATTLQEVIRGELLILLTGKESLNS